MKGEKPFSISKQVVWEAFEKVKKNKGAAGIDSQSIEDFEFDLENNLYKVWNRMSSGTYFPPPVREVAIPKKDGGKRYLGITTVTDRVAQTVVKDYMEPVVESHFHQDSYGYRPGKSAIYAVGKAREMCWKLDWVIDLDIRGFFDNLDHSLILESVRKYTTCRWTLLYIERWLKASVQKEDGTLIAKDRGTPQGGVISPLIANIVLHEAFDTWMQREFPEVPFERFADDIVVHCKTEKQARYVKDCIEKRLTQWKLELHPKKTKIVYCKDDNRKGSYPNEGFDFLGFTFKRRWTENKWGIHFDSFSPAVSNEAKKSMGYEMRQWRIPLHSNVKLDDIADMVNPTIRGWINYYGAYRKSELQQLFKRLNKTLTKWVIKKYKRFRRCAGKARKWLARLADREPDIFAHWALLDYRPTVG